MTTLKGKKDIINPTKKDIEKEFLNLQNNKIDFITLEKENCFIQAMIPDYNKKNNFYVEAHLENDISYKSKHNLSYLKTINLFCIFHKNTNNLHSETSLKKFDINQRYDVNQNNISQEEFNTSKKRGLIFSIFFIVFFVFGFGIYGSIVSNQSWYASLPFILIGLLQLLITLFISRLSSKYHISYLKKLSNIIKMPSNVVESLLQSGYSFEVKNKKDKKLSKLFFLEFAALILILLTAGITLFFLLVPFSISWYIYDQQGFINDFKNILFLQP